MKTGDKILIASGNPHKIKKITEIISAYFDEIVYLHDLEKQVLVEENGRSFEENASIKAKMYSEVFKGYVIATDGGVLIPALGEKWNELRTKRFIGEEKEDLQRIKALLEIMTPFEGEERRIKWKEAVAVAKEGKVLFSLEVEGIQGMIQKKYNEDQYRPGIWVCSVLFFPQFNKNFFELNSYEIEEVEVSWRKIGDKVQDFFKKEKD